jgi:hypothetical protein
MSIVALRARRWPLALSVAAIAALSACADEPLAPRIPPVAKPNASDVTTGEFVQMTVTSTSGGLDSGSIRWAATQLGSAGGAILFAPGLDGATITLDAPLDAAGPMSIQGPAKGITLSGNDQHRVIDSDSSVSVQNVTLTKGFADFGSAVSARSFSMRNTTVRDNRGPGSAIRVLDLASLVNSTVTGNVVGAPAVEYGDSSQVFIGNSTIAFNSPGAGLGPSGSVTSDVHVTLNNSILAFNGNGQNCSSVFNFFYEGKNISSDSSCGVGVVADPQLRPLANNGGPNLTHAFEPTSPALNGGVGCTVTTDQRHWKRDNLCDVGAFEIITRTGTALTADPTVRMDANGQPVLQGTLKCTRSEAFNLALELHQDQKVGRTTVDVYSAITIPVTCGGGITNWTGTMVPSEGAFQPGAARASVATLAQEWVSPTSVAGGVKIVRK